MGSNICSLQAPEEETNVNFLAFQYGEDTHQPKIIHEDSIICRESEIQKSVLDCQQRLKQSERLYKDPTMQTDPIILRSLSSETNQVKCTFERPYVFLSDPSNIIKGKSRKYKIMDVAECNPSQIVIRDQVMQSFGVLLCFLAAHPALINSIILTESNSYGICVVSMNVGARKEYVYCDDYILCSGKRPLFTQPIRNIYMWPCLLEKAWFKVKGSILNKIQSNSPRQIVKSFISCPIKNYCFVGGDQQFDKNLIQRHLSNIDPEKGYYISSKVQPTHKIGLSGRKHFYLLKVIDWEGQRLFYLRNPCASFEFRGIYSNLTAELMAKIKQITGDIKLYEGNFLLDEQELLEQIQSFSIIEYSKNSSQITEQPITLVINREFLILMDLKQDGLVSITFDQTSKIDKSKEIEYLPLLYHVVELNSNTLISDHQTTNNDNNAGNIILFDSIYKHLKAGQYLIRLKKKSLNKKISSLYDKPDKIIVTAPSKVKFDYKHLDLFDKYFRQFLLETGKQKLKDKMAKQNSDLTYFGVQFVVFQLGQIAAVYFQKTNESKKEVRVEIKFDSIRNYQCLSHQIGTSYFPLNPISVNEIIVFERKDLLEPASLGSFVVEPY